MNSCLLNRMKLTSSQCANSLGNQALIVEEDLCGAPYYLKVFDQENGQMRLTYSATKRNLKTWDMLFTWPKTKQRSMITRNEVWSQWNLRFHFEYSTVKMILEVSLQINRFSEQHIFLYLQSCGVDNSIDFRECFYYDEDGCLKEIPY